LSVDEKYLEKTLKTVMKSGKYVIGVKEVSKSVRGSKVVLYCTSTTGPKIDDLLAECGASNIPTFRFEPGSVKLGKLCGKNFRVSALAIKSAGEADLRSLIEKKE
jgi:large subunit ribosomal protein L30e